MSESKPKTFFTIDELAVHWSVSPIFVRRLVWSGELPATRFGRVVRIAVVQARAYETKHTSQPKQ